MTLVTQSTEHRSLLLRYARDTVAASLRGEGTRGVALPDVPGGCGGVFVTFWNRGALRGCVGTFAPTTDLGRRVAEVALASLEDPRFAANPIRADELADLTIEVSVLSDPVFTDDPLSLVPGRHGIIIRQGERTGCFLPKVATERGWSAEQFLNNCCAMKAGLEPDAWRSPNVVVMLFEAEVFSD